MAIFGITSAGVTKSLGALREGVDLYGNIRATRAAERAAADDRRAAKTRMERENAQARYDMRRQEAMDRRTDTIAMMSMLTGRQPASYSRSEPRESESDSSVQTAQLPTAVTPYAKKGGLIVPLIIATVALA